MIHKLSFLKVYRMNKTAAQVARKAANDVTAASGIIICCIPVDIEYNIHEIFILHPIFPNEDHVEQSIQEWTK